MKITHWQPTTSDGNWAAYESVNFRLRYQE